MSDYVPRNTSSTRNRVLNTSNSSISKKSPLSRKIIPESQGYADINYRKINIKNNSGIKENSFRGNTKLNDSKMLSPTYTNVVDGSRRIKNINMKSNTSFSNYDNDNSISSNFMNDDSSKKINGVRNKIPRINQQNIPNTKSENKLVSHNISNTKININRNDRSISSNQMNKQENFRLNQENEKFRINQNLNFVNNSHQIFDEYVENNNNFDNYMNYENEEEENEYENQGYEEQEYYEQENNQDISEQTHGENKINDNQENLEDNNDYNRDNNEENEYEEYNEEIESNENENISRRQIVDESEKNHSQNYSEKKINIRNNGETSELQQEYTLQNQNSSKSNQENSKLKNDKEINIKEMKIELNSSGISHNIQNLNSDLNEQLKINNLNFNNSKIVDVSLYNFENSNNNSKYINPKLINQIIKKESNLNSKNVSIIENIQNYEKIKVNLNECSKDELEFLEILIKNDAIKVENEEFFRNSKNELISKMEKNLIDKENKDFGINLHHFPLKKEINFVKETEKIISLEILNFRGILHNNYQIKNEKDLEIKSLKEIIKSLNNQINYKDEIIKNSIETNKKYNDLLNEFYNMKETNKKVMNENHLLKNKIKDVNNLNEVILKNYKNKLFDFGEISSKLFSTYFNEKNQNN